MSAPRYRAAVPTFQQVVLQCFGDSEFMAQYRRLSGAKLGLDERSLLDRLVDRATGNRPAIDEAEARAFFEFVRDHIFAPVVSACVAASVRVEEGGAA